MNTHDPNHGTAAAGVLFDLGEVRQPEPPVRAANGAAEWSNVQARNRGLYQVRVRGVAKVRAVVLLYALAHNLMQARVLRAKAAAAEATLAEQAAKTATDNAA
jgi:hypothetical protein